MNNVIIVAIRRPPITARPRGAFCSPPSPKAKAIGSMPSTIANAVISTGLRRVLADSKAASIGETSFSTRMSLAKLTNRIEFDVAIPIAMIDPISDSTLIVVPVMASIHRIPINAPGTAVMIMNGSSHD